MSENSPKSHLSLKGPEIMPVPPGKRDMKAWVFMCVWWGMAIQLVAFIAGAQLFPAFSPPMILLACVIGNGIVAILLTLTGDIGIKYGIPYAVYIRASFGYLGSHIPSLIRALFAIFWFGFQTWFCASALNHIMIILTGYSNMNMLIIAFAAVQVVNMMMGIKAVALLEKYAAPALMVVGFILLFLVLNKYDATVGQVLSMEGKGGMAFGFAVCVQMGHFITMAINIPDFTRTLVTPDPYKNSWWKTNFGSFWAQSIGLVSALTLFSFVGIVTGVLAGNWNPIEVIVEVIGNESLLLMILCLVFVLFAQWSTNTAANLLPPTYIIVNVYPRKINVKIAAVIAGAVGILLRPWVFADQVATILTASSALLGPVVGIMLCDYYLLRKRKLNVRDLYDANGQYRYAGNVNPAAIVAYVPAAILAFMFPNYGVQIAFGASMLVYYPAMKFWIAKKYYQPEIMDPNYTVEGFVEVDSAETA